VEAEVRLTGSALRLTVYIGENDTWHHKPLFAEIVHRARKSGLAGASVFRGVEGFGASSLIHTSRLLSLSEDLPVAVVIVDTEERIRGFLPQLDELVTEGLVTLDPCEVIRCTGRGRDGEGDGGSGGDAGAEREAR
jgi:PII-like signaling protein